VIRRRQSIPEAPAPSTTPTTPVERHLATAEAALLAVAGDRSLCDLSRAGAAGGVKECEGAVAALLEVRRALRTAPEPAAAVVTVLAAWRAELEAARGEAWVAYRRGGVVALEDLAADG
jgi:hypothetical protein